MSMRAYIEGVEGMNDTIVWLTEPEAAQRLGVSVATLRRWRRLKEGPPWYRLGHSVKYQIEQIDKFINDRKQT
jgi:predicted DNA-binding transcriptional regulator AlpA